MAVVEEFQDFGDVVWLHVSCAGIFVRPAVAKEQADIVVGEIHLAAGEDDFPLRPPEHASRIEAGEAFGFVRVLDSSEGDAPFAVCGPARRWMQTGLDVSGL